MTSNGQIHIGFDGDEVMQRYLARRIWKEVELAVVETDGTRHIGFITGLDDTCIQISTSPEHAADAPHAVLVFWPIRRIEETGRRLSDLKHEDCSRIRTYGSMLRQRCERVVRNKPARLGEESSAL